MHNRRKIGLGILALGVCLCLSLAWGGFAAFAAVPWYGTGSNTLTVEATNNEEYAADIANANVVVDLYRVATAAKDPNYDTYNYTWESPFGEGAIDTSKLDAEGWQKLAVDACTQEKLGTGDHQTDHQTLATGAQSEKIDDGLYLVVPHGADMAVAYDDSGAAVLQAHTATQLYTFTPSLVSLPSKTDLDGGMSGHIETSFNYGDWKRDITIKLKVEQLPLFGSVRIYKDAKDFSGEAQTFVFHLTGSMQVGSGETARTITYDNYAAITYDGTEESASTVVTHIPAGMTVHIEETYSGAKYSYESGEGDVTIVADDVDPTSETGQADGSNAVGITFENTRTKTTGGNGIENHFDFSSDEAGYAWQLRRVTPESAKVEE